MPATYEPIATTTLGAASYQIEFTSISATYTDLRIVLVCRSDYGSTPSLVNLRLNANSATNYSVTQLIGDGSTATSSRESTKAQIFCGDYPTATATSGIFGLITIDVFSYAGSTYKTVLVTNSQDMNGSGAVRRSVGLWRSTSAVTSLQLQSGNGDFIAGTTATLYGILKA